MRRIGVLLAAAIVVEGERRRVSRETREIR
ncbi:hypothetical protein LINGRAHAP2_LOCUS13033 [Linum grandiflorum]